MDMTQESAATQRLYGIDTAATENFGRQCLMARRFAEAGVRFIEVAHTGWDQHNALKARHAANAAAVDKPIAGLLTDLKQRGLLKDTRVIWRGEFGRTPMAQNRDGRDHNRQGFSLWLAGGGFEAGYVHGATDEFGGKSVNNVVRVYDLHATLLHALGLEHTRLSYPHEGRMDTLTDSVVSSARVKPALLA